MSKVIHRRVHLARTNWLVRTVLPSTVRSTVGVMCLFQLLILVRTRNLPHNTTAIVWTREVFACNVTVEAFQTAPGPQEWFRYVPMHGVYG